MIGMLNVNEIHDIKINFVVQQNSKVTNKILDKVVKLLYKCGVKFLTINDEISVDLETEEVSDITE
jgi:hypothetical protein